MKITTAVLGDEASIWNPLIRPNEKLSKAAARGLLGLNFHEADRARMHELARKNQVNQLMPKEQTELGGYLKVGLILDLIHGQANH